MKFIKVRINEGGKVFMEDEKKSKPFDEEHAINAEFCDVINADRKLKAYFAESLSRILKTFAKEMIMAYEVKDEVKASAAMQQAGEAIKGLTMFMHVKAVLKKKEVKP